jgi:hypothetical protein
MPTLRVLTLLTLLLATAFSVPALAQEQHCTMPTPESERALHRCSISNCGDRTRLHALSLYRQAEQPPLDGARALFCQAAIEFDLDVRRNPHYERVDLVRYYLARSLERCGYESLAAQILTEVARDISQRLRQEGDRPHACESLGLLAAARFAAAETWSRLHIFEAALAELTALIEDDRSEQFSNASVIRREGSTQYVELGLELNRHDEVERLLRQLMARPAGSFGPDGSAFLQGLLSRIAEHRVQGDQGIGHRATPGVGRTVPQLR